MQTTTIKRHVTQLIGLNSDIKFFSVSFCPHCPPIIHDEVLERTKRHYIIPSMAEYQYSILLAKLKA